MRRAACFAFVILASISAAQEMPAEIGKVTLLGSKVNALGLNHKGDAVVVGSTAGMLATWDPSAPGFVQIAGFTGHKKSVAAAAFAPDDKTFLTASDDGKVKIWDSAECTKFQKEATDPDKALKPLDPKPKKEFTAHATGIAAAAWAPDGKSFATAGLDGSVKLWDADGKNLATFKAHAGPVRGVAFNPDGDRLATAGEKVVKLWTVGPKPKLDKTLDGFKGPVLAVVFSKDGKWLAAGGGTTAAPELALYETADWSKRHPLAGHEDAVTCLAFHPSGDRFVSGSDDKTIRVWNVAALKEAFKYKSGDGLKALSYGGDGKMLGSTCHKETKWFRANLPLPK